MLGKSLGQLLHTHTSSGFVLFVFTVRKSLLFVCLLLPDENYMKILYFKSCIH